MDGFILSANNKLYRVFLDKEQLKKISFNVGDKVSLLAPKAEVWFDSDYPAIKPKNVKITSGVGVVPPKVIPRLISSTGLIADNRNNIFYIKKGKIEIGDHVLEAEEMIISAKKGTLKVKDGNVLTGESLIYDLKARTYQVNNAVGNVRQVESSVYDLMNKLPYHASDSVRISKTKDIMTLYGKASIDFDGKRLSGDKIEINNYTHVVTAYNAELLGYDTEIVKAEVISYNLNTNKRRFQGVQKN
jgi:lipopolysaccharide export system protein LptA